jgi:hypothetical protein
MTDNDIIEEAVRLVREGVNVTLPVKGLSMLPFIIGGKESVILHRPGLIDVGDVVLAWVDGNRYVVHRIIKLDYDRVTLMGDGNLTTEHCALGDIKARVTHVVDAKDKTHYLYNKWRKSAAKVWYWLRPIRRYLLAIYRRVRR